MLTKPFYTFFHLSNVLAIVTGILYGYLKYYLKQDSLFGKIPHPLTSNFLNIHLLISIFLVLSIGSLASLHIIPKIKSNRVSRRKTGLSLTALSFLMIFSGFIIQVQNSIEVKYWVGISHSIFSTCWIVLIALHLKLK